MPDWAVQLRLRLAGLRLGPAREAEIIEELSQHLDQRYEELRVTGMGELQAMSLVAGELQEPETLATYMTRLRQANAPPPLALGEAHGSWHEALRQDLRFAARTLLRQPGFALAAILTLALGIGANGAIFALVDATLLRPLPFSNPERLVMVWEESTSSSRGRVAPSNMLDWSRRNQTFEAIGGYIPGIGAMVMSGAGGTAESVTRQWVTAGIFEALGVRAVAGRTFTADDDRPGNMVTVISEAFWRTRFNADPTVVGRVIRFDGTPYTVIGVVPAEAAVLGDASMWALLLLDRLPPQARGAYFLQTIGRLKAGTTIDQGGEDLASVAAGLAREFPRTNTGRGVALQPLHEAVIGAELRYTSLLFLGVVGFVLLICCGNVANLLMTRATARVRELAIRSALGASRLRVVRQLVTESLMLAAIGGVLGMAVGTVILRFGQSVVPPELLPAGVPVVFDARVGAFCAAAALAVGVLFGLGPAWQATGRASAFAMTSDTRTTAGHGNGVRRLLVAGEVATAVVLLFGAGLLLRTLLAVEGVDRGYRAESVLTMTVDPLASSYPTNERLMQFYQDVEREVRAVPGVREVAWASTLPLGGSSAGSFAVEVVGAPVKEESQRPVADYQIVSPAYFRALDLAVVVGRAFDDRDTTAAPLVCIVNEAFVRMHLGGRSPVGLRVAMRPSAVTQAKTVVREIVGVARQVKGRPDETQDLVQVYVPIAQSAIDDTYMVVRPVSGPAEALAPAVRAAIGRVDREKLVGVRDVMTLDSVARVATARHRFRAVLVGAFAALAVLLAMVGLFGVLAYGIQQRVRDFGVRRVLGATTSDVLRLVIGDASKMIGIGVAIGLAFSALAGRALTTMLFGVQPLDPATFALVILAMVVTAAVSTIAPAWRASRIDPAEALRAD
jgi:putative ABC transport system permease protein